MNLALRTLLVTLAVFLTFGIAALVLNVAYDIELQDLVIRHHLAGSSLEAPVDLSGDENATPDYKWDYLMLVLTWPETFCEHAKEMCLVPKAVKGFSLHGLWPQRNDTKWVENCPGKPFSRLKILDILPSLTKFWGNLLPFRDMFSLWRHEWERHGKCAAYNATRGVGIYNQRSYFKAAVAMRRDYDPIKSWVANEITPSNKTLYLVKDMREAFAKQYGAKPVLSCTYSAKLKQQAVSEVKICFDKNFAIMNCPAAIEKRGCWDTKKILLTAIWRKPEPPTWFSWLF